ncbi:MAG: hypothetical protein HY270_12410 [Deltaproteobacteria bacterium]|nr:hypothetical protein [Deltaproteobacteria bacterium]
MRALWQQRRASGAAEQSNCAYPIEGGGFGEEIPRSAQIARVIVRNPAAKFECCVAWRLHPLSSEFGSRRRIVLGGLPAGAATVQLSGFPGDAPADGVKTTCAVVAPSDVAQACDLHSCDTPSFDSEPADVSLEEGKQTDAGVLELCGKAFVLHAVPECDGELIVSEQRFASLEYTIAIANDLDASLPGPTIGMAQGTPTPMPCADSPATCEASLPVRLGEPSGCYETVGPDGVPLPQDPGTPCCSPNCELNVSGYRIQGRVVGLQVGPARARVALENMLLDLRYGFDVVPESPTPAPPTATPTPAPSGRSGRLSAEEHAQTLGAGTATDVLS